VPDPDRDIAVLELVLPPPLLIPPVDNPATVSSSGSTLNPVGECHEMSQCLFPTAMTLL
jgi:hypothetical protein